MTKLVLLILLFQIPNSWSETSTLKLIEILHRHGERTPLEFIDGDPFGHQKYWPMGLGQLTLKGKHRMYKMGEFFRKNYSEFFNKINHTQVYSRSSIQHRCIESGSVFLAGAFPPAPEEDWSEANPEHGIINLGKQWQPFPIETFMPKQRDTLLVAEVPCHIADEESYKIITSDKVTKFLEDRKELLVKLSEAVNKTIDNINEIALLWQSLEIESYQFNYWWTHVWTKEQQIQIMNQFDEIGDFLYEILWKNQTIQKLRSGILIEQIYQNMKQRINGTSNNRFYHYSAHDTTIAPLLHLLDSFNNKFVPFGATVIFELHQKENYFVKIYYLNDTYSDNPHLLNIGICDGQTQCPLDKFYQRIKQFFVNDFDVECGNQ